MNNIMGNIETWKKLGLMDGIDEEYHKYLSDLYDALEDELRNVHALSYDHFTSDDYNNQEIPTIMRSIKSLVELNIFPTLKNAFSLNKTISFNEFVDGFNNAYIDAEKLVGYAKEGKFDEVIKEVALEINNAVKNND